MPVVTALDTIKLGEKTEVSKGGVVPASVTLLNVPDLLAPVNKELWFVADSGSSDGTDFKYTFRVNWKNEPFSNTYSVGNTYKVPPRPDNGWGIFSPHRYLKSFFTYNFNPWQQGWMTHINAAPYVGVPNNLIKYYLDYGYDYNPELIWYDTYYTSGNLGLTFSTPHGLVTGDIIYLDKTNKTINPQYDGTCSVTAVINAYHIQTNKAWGQNSTLEDGVISNVSRIVGTSSERLTFNGTRQYLERTKDFSQYILGSATASFLTYYNGVSKPVIRGAHEYETLSLILPAYSNYNIKIDLYDTSGVLQKTDLIYKGAGINWLRCDIGIGPQNISDALGYDLESLADYYEVTIRDGSTPISETRRYTLVDDCSPYEKVRMIFLNRLGGWDYFTFTRDNKKTLNITRTEYSRTLDWNYGDGRLWSSSDRGATNLATGVETTWTINSNWITEKEATWLEELMTSPEVYIIQYSDPSNPTPGTGNVLPIIITNTSYEVKTALRDRVFNMVVTYKMAFPTNLQNQ